MMFWGWVASAGLLSLTALVMACWLGVFGDTTGRPPWAWWSV